MVDATTFLPLEVVIVEDLSGLAPLSVCHLQFSHHEVRVPVKCKM
jgi:hypothetical protein